MYEIIKYSKDNLNIDVRFDKENHTIWLTQSEIALVFDISRDNVKQTIKRVHDSLVTSAVGDNLSPTEAIVSNVGLDGKTYKMKLYNLSIIKEILKRNKSISGNAFVELVNGLINNNQHNGLVEIPLDEDVKSKIYYIRGERVMLDFELAELYGYDTKAFNQQVQRNIEKFPSRYMFKLTKDELNNLSWSQNVTLNNGRGYNFKYLPYAFTEQGIYMLMTVLKGELATKQSIMLIDTFKAMKDYIIENNGSISNISLINDKFEKQDRRFLKIENQLSAVMENFIDPSNLKHFLILDGDKIESDIAYQTIYKMAKKSIIIIDDYIDTKTFQLLNSSKDNVEITIISDNKAKKHLSIDFICDFEEKNKIDLSLIKNNNVFHSRYIVLDYKEEKEIIYHCGGSSKDGGNKIDTIQMIDNPKLYEKEIEKALNNPYLLLKKQKV